MPIFPPNSSGYTTPFRRRLLDYTSFVVTLKQALIEAPCEDFFQCLNFNFMRINYRCSTLRILKLMVSLKLDFVFDCCGYSLLQTFDFSSRILATITNPSDGLISLTRYPSGVYFLRVQLSDGRIEHLKFVKE